MPFSGAGPHARYPAEAGCSSRRRPETVHQGRLACTAVAVPNAAPYATDADLGRLPGSGANIDDHSARWSGIEIARVFPTVETGLGGTLEVLTETLPMNGRPGCVRRRSTRRANAPRWCVSLKIASNESAKRLLAGHLGREREGRGRHTPGVGGRHPV